LTSGAGAVAEDDERAGRPGQWHSPKQRGAFR
jgi:hypothetical protein